jgi:hypothetical protein
MAHGPPNGSASENKLGIQKVSTKRTASGRKVKHTPNKQVVTIQQFDGYTDETTEEELRLVSEESILNI